MREHVDLEVAARGAGGVEFTLRAPARALSPWRSIGYALWLAAAASASAWHAQSAPRHATAAWLAYATVACGLAAYLLQLATGAVVVEESVLVVPSLGVQLRRRTRSGATTKRFLDASDIRAVVVNEGFVFSDVVYYIAFMVHSKDDMVLAFEHFRPRIAVLQEIFVNMRQSLFPEESTMRLPHLE